MPGFNHSMPWADIQEIMQCKLPCQRELWLDYNQEYPNYNPFALHVEVHVNHQNEFY
jgi:hypothetical protein